MIMNSDCICMTPFVWNFILTLLKNKNAAIVKMLHLFHIDICKSNRA